MKGKLCRKMKDKDGRGKWQLEIAFSQKLCNSGNTSSTALQSCSSGVEKAEQHPCPPKNPKHPAENGKLRGFLNYCCGRKGIAVIAPSHTRICSFINL